MLVEIGEILKPRGLKGELKVEVLFNRPEIFNELREVFIGQNKYAITKSSLQNGFGYLNLAGIDKIEKAESFRGKKVAIEESELHLQGDEVLSTELIGFTVLQSGHKIGTVKSVENYGAGDFFEIALTGNGYVQIPNEDDFVLETNMTNRTLTLTPNALQEELV